MQSFKLTARSAWRAPVLAVVVLSVGGVAAIVTTDTGGSGSLTRSVSSLGSTSFNNAAARHPAVPPPPSSRPPTSNSSTFDEQQIGRLYSSNGARICSNHPNFFSAGDRNALYRYYGPLAACIAISNPQFNGWVVAVSEIGGRNPAGDVLLVDNCTSTICTSAAATHSLSTFTVYPAPDPQGNLLQIQQPATDLAKGVIGFNDGKCGLVLFDISTGRWYQGSEYTYATLTGSASSPGSPPTPIPSPTSYEWTSTPPAAAGTVPAVCNVPQINAFSGK